MVYINEANRLYNALKEAHMTHAEAATREIVLDPTHPMIMTTPVVTICTCLSSLASAIG